MFDLVDRASIKIIGFAEFDTHEGAEIAKVWPAHPEELETPDTDGLRAMIIYGMAGVGAAGGVAFPVFSRRALKKEEGIRQ